MGYGRIVAILFGTGDGFIKMVKYDVGYEDYNGSRWIAVELLRYCSGQEMDSSGWSNRTWVIYEDCRNFKFFLFDIIC